MPYKDKDVNREWDRKRNAESPARRFSNSIGRYKRKLRVRIARKEQQLEQLEEILNV